MKICTSPDSKMIMETALRIYLEQHFFSSACMSGCIFFTLHANIYFLFLLTLYTCCIV
uniref:Uncharacterized protein n=1 Tax=Arundo donax TaxID=35708 RepID=A0A0A9H4S5_ARUDO